MSDRTFFFKHRKHIGKKMFFCGYNHSPPSGQTLNQHSYQQSSINTNHPKWFHRGQRSCRPHPENKHSQAPWRAVKFGAASFVKERRKGCSPRCPRRTATSSLFDGGKPESHVRASGGEHHVAGVELDALQGPGVLSLQHSGLTPILGVPHVDPSVLWSCKMLKGVIRHRKRGSLFWVYVIPLLGHLNFLRSQWLEEYYPPLIFSPHPSKINIRFPRLQLILLVMLAER